MFVSVEVAVDVLPVLVVHLLHAIAATSMALGLASFVIGWSRSGPATNPVPRDGDRPADLTEMDDDILALLDRADAVMTPALVSYNLDYSRESVNRHLRRLESHGLVDRVDRGKYRLSSSGQGHPYWPVPTTSPAVERALGASRRVGTAARRRLANLRRASR